MAMNKLAKSVGIKRGTPIFKCRDLIQQHQIEVRSSNFTLYEDYSNRFHETLESFAPQSSFIPNTAMLGFGLASPNVATSDNV
ncbi:Y-family DNA polymerase [Salmonella enterica]|uniref:Y-family DNA polymerase n=1 Tax=Salmonella enterica TaxID=28901 RepID=UPI0021584E6B|nr:hypothetical protein [Salmonella enterica]